MPLRVLCHAYSKDTTKPLLTQQPTWTPVLLFHKSRKVQGKNNYYGDVRFQKAALRGSKIVASIPDSCDPVIRFWSQWPRRWWTGDKTHQSYAWVMGQEVPAVRKGRKNGSAVRENRFPEVRWYGTVLSRSQAEDTSPHHNVRASCFVRCWCRLLSLETG